MLYQKIGSLLKSQFHLSYSGKKVQKMLRHHFDNFFPYASLSMLYGIEGFTYSLCRTYNLSIRIFVYVVWYLIGMYFAIQK